MKKKLIALIAMLGIVLSTPANAWYYGGWSPYGGSLGFYGGLGAAGAIVGGLAAGAIVAGSRPYGYYDNYYGYYGAPVAPRYYYAPAPRYYYYGY